jgi:hypothetical protein
MQAPRWVLIWRSQGEKKKLAAAVVQLGGSVLIWRMTGWFSTACYLLFIWATFKKQRPLLNGSGSGQPRANDQRPTSCRTKDKRQKQTQM